MFEKEALVGAVTFNSEIILSQRGAKYNRSEWRSGKALAFETIGRGFAPRQRFLVFTRGRRRRFSFLIYSNRYTKHTYASYMFLSFSHVDQGAAFFAAAYDLPLCVDVGDTFTL